MAITRNRQIIYESLPAIIEHKTGKRVRSWKSDQSSMSIFILFEDGSMGVIENGYDEVLDIQPYEVPKSFCASCGEEWHVSKFDWNGRCETRLRNFWKKARKVYWHRYIKNNSKT